MPRGATRRFTTVAGRMCAIAGAGCRVRVMCARCMPRPLVGWVGTPRVSYSGSFAGVAWFPLGPREVYVPGRRFSPRYVERVNVSNTTIISRAVVREVYENRARNVNYRNRTMPGAVTAVSRAAFTSSERVGNHRVSRQRAGDPARGVCPQCRRKSAGAGAAVASGHPNSQRNRQSPPPGSRCARRAAGGGNRAACPASRPGYSGSRHVRSRIGSQRLFSSSGEIRMSRAARRRAWSSNAPAMSSSRAWNSPSRKVGPVGRRCKSRRSPELRRHGTINRAPRGTDSGVSLLGAHCRMMSGAIA